MSDLAIILTARSGSERLPDKCLYEIKGKSLLHWIIKRLSGIKNAQVILATTHLPDDDRVAEVGQKLKIPVYRGYTKEVVARMDEALRKYAPDAKLVLRGLGDLPFLATELVERACEVLLKYPDKDAILWHLPPEIWPVYGARELPYSREGWNRIARGATDRAEQEHPDLWFHHERRRFKILYHEPPKTTYFRDYRLEVDYPEDIRLVEEIAKAIGMTKSLVDVIDYLDSNDNVAKLNRERVEKTGPLTSYNYDQRRMWMYYMIGQPVLGWDNRWRKPLSDKSSPIFCWRGHLLGFAQDGILHTEDGKIQLEAGKVKCRNEDCGSSRIWHEAIARSV